MMTVEFEQPCRPTLFRGNAANAIGKLRPKLLPVKIGCVPMQEVDLCRKGEIDVAGQFCAGPNAAGLNAAMTFGKINVLRGGEPRARGL